jgi:hypothetical protein
MWSIIIAIALIDSKGQETPKLVSSYPTLRDCRLELIEVAKALDYDLVVSPLLGYSVKKDRDGRTIVAFCVQNQKGV